MIAPVSYSIVLDEDDEEHKIMITPVVDHLPNGNSVPNGVFKLTERGTGMGHIVFDDNMNQWEYTGLGSLTHKEAEEIAGFIRTYDDSDAALQA